MREIQQLHANPYRTFQKLAKTKVLLASDEALTPKISTRVMRLVPEKMNMRLLWCLLLVIGFACGGCSKPPEESSSSTAKKKPKSSGSSSYRPAPGPASAQRKAFNEGGKESLSSKSGVDELFIKDLDSSNTESVKAAIEHLQGNKVKSALPKLESLAKNHKNADIKRRAQAAVTSIKK